MDGEAMRWMLNFQFMIHLPFESIQQKRRTLGRSAVGEG